MEDGSWLEVTLREGAAHKKAFLYAHQTHKLKVVYLFRDEKYKNQCPFPNTTILSIYEYFTLKEMRLYVYFIEYLISVAQKKMDMNVPSRVVVGMD